MKPTFNNRHNKNHIIDGKEIWISRSPAVAGFIFAISKSGIYVLVIKRSEKMEECPNKYAAPSGYLDWDESGFDAVTREIYEETSLYLPYYAEYLVGDNNKKPFLVQDDPNENKSQNITLAYVMKYDFTKNEEMFPDFIKDFKCEETAEVIWMKYSDVIENKNRDWAFNHQQRFNDAFQHMLYNWYDSF